jgi:HELP motif
MATRTDTYQAAAPTTFTKPLVNQENAPNIDVELQWVHGYRGGNNRNNMFLNKDGHLVYNAAAVGVVYDPVLHAQKFFRGYHTDDITCIAMSPDGRMVATGEMGARDTAVSEVKKIVKGKEVVEYKKGKCKQI